VYIESIKAGASDRDRQRSPVHLRRRKVGPVARKAPTRALDQGSCAMLIAALIVSALACGEPTSEVDRPNIVMIIGDDHGFEDFGFAGSPIVKTPNLDRLAAEGTVFSRTFVTASICDPSLRSLATGLHPMQRQMRMNYLESRNVRRGYAGDVVDFETLPRRLASAGYRSFQAGKFFGGSYDLAGFSDGMNGPEVDLRFGGPARKTLARTTQQPVYDFLDTVGEQPFFLWYAPMLPHHPFDAGPEYTKAYEGLGLSPAARRYYANVTRFDARVGELLGALEDRNLRDDTLIVYLADNGWDQKPKAARVVKNWDSDGEHGKRSMYELGFRTPLIFHWPRGVPKGQVFEDLVSSVDLYPTLLDYAGAGDAADRPGMNLRSRIDNKAGANRQAVFAAMGDIRSSPLRPASLPNKGVDPAAMVRSEDWYFISYEKWGAEELFDMLRDPKQTENVADRHPEVVARLQSDLRSWRDRMAAVYRPSMIRPPRKRITGQLEKIEREE
jgi:arylsulfatase A-like enzyme